MSQRYAHPTALDRMAEDKCPECGEFPSAHLDHPGFWLPRECDLMPRGVVDRIEQYRADLAAHEARA